MKQRVLIVDDSLTVRMDIGEALQSAGFDTALCADLRSAREALALEGAALVVLDILLPDGDGLDFLKELRSSPATAQIPVLLLSTEAEVKNRVRGMGAGAGEYIGKPYDLGQVVARARALTQADARGGALAGRRVLVIDDSVTFRNELKQSLEGAGYQVQEAATGEEGLALAGADRPDAVIVDGILPGIDGATVVRRLKSDTALRSTPCLLLTAAEGTNDELRALEAGADAYVRKSEDLGVILVRLAALLRGAIAAGGERSPSLLGPKRLLAVDDSLTYLNELGSQLRQEGYDVVLATSGEEALELLAVQSVDCILLDLVMPGLSGHETCRLIKKRAEWRDIPLVMLTARDDQDAVIEGINAGADDYIAKSADFDILKARLRAQLRRKHFEDENRRIREQLVRKETEARFQRLIHSNIIGVILGDLGGRLTDANDAFLAMLGYSRADLESGKLRWREGTPSEGHAQTKTAIEQLRSVGSATPYENEYVRKDGSRLPTMVGLALMDGTDAIVGFVLDRTEQKLAEEKLKQYAVALEEANSELRRQHEVFEKFFTLSLDMLGIAGPDGYFQRLNPAFDALGYDEGELLSHPFIDFVHPEDRASTLAEVEKLAAGVPTTLENRYRCKDGSYRWLLWTAAPDASGTLYAVARDITERKRIEETTQQTNQFLEAVLENIPHMVFVKDAERLAYVRFNRAGEALLGVSRSELLDKTDHDLFPKEDAELFQAKDRGTLGACVLVDIPEEPIQTKRGQRLLHTKKVPILDSSGKPLYLLGISEDITERKAGEEAGARLAAIVESSDDAIISRTITGVITSWNRGASELFGYKAEEVIGQPLSMLFPAKRLDEDEEAQLTEQLLRNEQVEPFETVRRRKDGRDIDISVRLSPLRDPSGRIVGVSKIARDISERKAAEAALATKNRELEVAARIDRIGARVMVALSQQDATAKPSAEVLRVLAEEAGYRPLAFYDYDEWQGGLVLEAGLSLAPGYDHKKFRVGEGLVGEAAAKRQPVFVDGPASLPFSLDTGVGVLATATLFAIPLLHREKLLGVVAGAAQTPLLGRERSWLTQVAGQVAVGLYAIRQFQELKDLSQQLNERSRKIEAQNRELAHASRLKSEFLASMSHELRTPLNAIIGFSEALKDGLLGDLQPDQLDYATEVYQSGRHLLSLINDILDLSKVEAGKMELDVEAVDVVSLIGNALTIMKERAAKGGVAVTHTIAPGIATLDADGRKLRQIIYNLLSNAVKFTPSGGSVRVEVTRVEEQVEFAVVDSGIGISPEERSRLFRPFEQLDGGIARKFEGTGLGLVMVKNLVELHGGTIGVESEAGKGSRFWVRLPATRADTQGPRAATSVRVRPTELASSETPRVLVVDDDPAAISLARRWLEKEGYAVEGAETCDAAWAEICRQPPDAILLDILFENGPGGWEFLERLRGAPEHAHIPVVVVSVVADLGRGLALGALEVLQKPVAGTDLLRAVESLGIAPSKTGESPRVLVVDDDPRSVEHVSKCLERAGMSVTRAYGGREALAAIATNGFSTMVLDLIMPEVSGFDVVRELRANHGTADFPIIILSAKVLEPAERAMLEKSVHMVLSKEDWDQGKFLQVIRHAIRVALQRKEGGTARPSHVHVEVRRPAPSLVKQLRILAINDDPTARDLLRLYFEDAGFAVTLASSAEDAFAKLGGLRPDLITVDLTMPGMDGAGFLAEYGQSEHLRGIPILVVSSAGNPQNGLAVGAHAVLAKPVRRHEFLELIGRMLSDLEGRRPYILVVDDDPRAVKIVTSYFSDEPVEVGAAYGGREGLDLVQARRPDLLILDLMMPEVSGFDVLAQLRASPNTADLPVVILTAKELTAAERSALAQDVQAVFGKAIAGRGDIVDQARSLLGMSLTSEEKRGDR